MKLGQARQSGLPFAVEYVEGRSFIAFLLQQRANVLLPEPDTPISTTKESSGIVSFIQSVEARKEMMTFEARPAS